MERKLIFLVLFVQSVIEIRGRNPVRTPDQFEITCNTTVCEIQGYDPDSTMMSTNLSVPTENIQEIRLHPTGGKLTSNVCDAFSNLLVIFAAVSRLEEIEPNAFRNCSKLKVVQLSSNKLTSLDNSIFETNHELEEIHLGYNQLIAFNTSILNHSPKLKLLDLKHNQLAEFDVNDMSIQLMDLRFVELQNNKLRELNLRDVSNKFPNIRTLDMSQNLIRVPPY